MCVLLAIIFFINPVLATADALFSSLTPLGSLDLMADSESDMPCHQEKTTDSLKSQYDYIADMSLDCCEDNCQCANSGCHASSLVFQHQASIMSYSLQAHIYHLPIYLSLAVSPKSPPPII